MTISIPTTAKDQLCFPSDEQVLLTEAMDLLTCIESSLQVADVDTQMAVARLAELYLGADDGDHFPTVLNKITQLRDRIYIQVDQAA